jgi:hypothetical protein
MYEVIAPDVVVVFGPQTDARSVVQPEPALLRLLARNLQPLPFSEPLDTADADLPACISQQNGDAAVPVFLQRVSLS